MEQCKTEKLRQKNPKESDNVWCTRCQKLCRWDLAAETLEYDDTVRKSSEELGQIKRKNVKGQKNV